MRNFLVLAGLLLSLAAAHPATAADQNSGAVGNSAESASLVGETVWDSAYQYADGRAGVPFKLWLTVSESGAVTGRTEEPATFGNGKVQTLTATLRGKLTGDALAFVKQYDGKGGVAHAVSYQVIVAEDLESILGTWKVSKSTGTFKATRVQE